MTKWTPGPWHMGIQFQDEFCLSYWTIGPFPAERHDEDSICEVWGGEHPGKSNAHLIAAAPELYQALEKLMDQPTKHPLKMTPDQRGNLWDAHRIARGALAKARGEKP